MCGIAGIVWKGNPEVTRPLIRRMTDAIAHRGPDAGGHYEDEMIALGHRRLSIIDLSPDANQPFWDASGRYAIIFNGEVYNFKDIRRELVNYPFRTKCDTEVILAAYIEWGEACLSRFFGMFAFAVWDNQEKTLFLVRDRLGIKPLYFFQDGSKFLFASEIRAILASGLVPKKLDREGLQDYLQYQTVHAPRTIVENIYQLNPGECAVLKGGVLTKKTYWKLVPEQVVKTGGSYEEVKKEVRRLMLESVERRLVSDVPLGAFLSGGIDSTAVVALMSEVTVQAVDTFSVVFEEEQFDESVYSGLVARRFNTRHHPLLLKPADFLEALPHALQAMDSPSGDAINTYVVSRVTKEAGVTVALSGLGGDELFAGYPLFLRYVRLRNLPFFWKIPAGIRTAAMRMVQPFFKSHQQERLREVLTAENGRIEEVYPSFRKVLTDAESGLLASKNGHSQHKFENAVVRKLREQQGLEKLPLLSQVTVADISTYTQNVLLKDTDQMSMAHALEVRVPFFDHALVEYVLCIPDRWKYPAYAKKLLVESLAPLIPNEVVFRPKKGFELPWKMWLKNELSDFARQRLQRIAERQLMPPQVLETLWTTFSKGKNDQLWSRIWVLVVLEDWMERNL